MNKLPLFELIIDESIASDVEVAAVAFVDKPAIERNFLAFKSEQLHFAINEEERIVSGPAMIPDSPIYRSDPTGEYNVFFSAETIKQISLKFLKKDYHKNLNLFHDPALSLEGVTIFESFVSSKKRGIRPMDGFKDLPDGTWFISAKVENDEVWNKIKSGEVKGFSVEGIFSYVKKGENRTESHNSHLEESNILMADLKDMLKDLKQTFMGGPQVPATPVPTAAHDTLNTDFTLKDGTAVSIDRLEQGGVVLVGGAPAAAGEYELQDGTKLSVSEGGVIATVTPVSETPAPDFSAQFATYDQKFSDYEAKFTAYEERFANQEKLIGNANATIVQLVSIVEKLAEAPTADPLGDNKTSFSAARVESKEDKLKSFTAAFQKIKNKTN